ncbi:MAG: aldolase catalytic domain-containing protein [Muribaculaceae bacterium]|nr:aldolase catalytic domain-containing protein [Muribaculaceae bacterium]
MKKVTLLDCTLRDGGFLNDWNFGHNSILSIYRRLAKSGVEIIEAGFINAKKTFDINRTINPSTSCFDEIFKGQEKKAKVLGMIDFGTCPIENISVQKDSFLDGIRVIFKKKDIVEAIKFCRQIKEKGYELYVNPVSITTYSDREMLDLIDLVNDLAPKAMSLVDTYGLLHKERLFRYFYLLDSNLNPDIEIGYHSHNNFQLAYANAIELLNLKTDRGIILDSSLYGMGKSAGNCNTELLAMYLNNNYDKNYNIPEILNTIDLEILKYTKQFAWGYRMSYYLSAINDCHPNYVTYLEKKNMLPVKDINAIVAQIDDDKKLVFNEAHIEELYQRYQRKSVDDTKDYEDLSKALAGKTILLLGPGKSIKDKYDTIAEYIEHNAPAVFSVNHINSLFKSDYIFISNAKRYDQFIDLKNDKQTKLITTSNIVNDNGISDYILNWDNLISTKTVVGESSLYLLINALVKLKVNKVVLAGFDGFSKVAQNYYDNNYQFYEEDNNANKVTRAISKQIDEFQKLIQIEFLTQSHYQKRGKALNV